MPPPLKDFEEEADIKLIVPVPVTVRLVETAVDQAVVPESVHVPEPMAIVRVLVLEELAPPVEPDKVTL